MANKKMKLLFVNPPYNPELYFGKLASLRYVFPPMGILSLAAYLREKGHQAALYDFEVFHEDFTTTLRKFKPDFVGITCPTILVESTLKIAQLVKATLPKTMVIVGGPHPTSRPIDLLSSGTVDIAVRGEGELILEELINAYASGITYKNINGISFIDNGVLVNNPFMKLIENLDNLPIPAVDLVPIEKYRPSPDLTVGKKAAAIFTSRGCPYECIFCANNISFNFKYRERPLDKVFSEIEYYIKNYNIDSLLIMDDTFCVNYKRVKAFCAEMIKRNLHKTISWWAQTRVDRIDEDLARLMKEAGCHTLSLGLESGVQRILDISKKKINLKDVPKAVNSIKRSGILSRASFILGLPTETLPDSLATILFALSLSLDFCKFSLATPYPGTELWNIAESEGKLEGISGNWHRFTQMAGFTDNAPLYFPDKRSPSGLKLLQRFANAVYYLKPGVTLGMYKRFRKMGQSKQFFLTIWTGLKACLSPPGKKTRPKNRD